jgi:hypothetical protein
MAKNASKICDVALVFLLSEKGHCSSQSTISFVLKQCVLLTKPNLAFVGNYSGSVKMVA